MSCPENYKLTNDASRCEIIKQPSNTWYSRGDETFYSNTPRGYKYDGVTKLYYKDKGLTPAECSNPQASYSGNGGIGKCVRFADFINRQRREMWKGGPLTSGGDCPRGTEALDKEYCYNPKTVPDSFCRDNTTYIPITGKCYPPNQTLPLGVYPKYKPIQSKQTFGAMNGSGLNWLVILLVLILAIIAIRWYIKKQSKVPALTQFGRMARSIKRM